MPGDTAQLPRLDVWLRSVDESDVVSHSGTAKGVAGSLFIPATNTDTARPNIRAEPLGLLSTPNLGPLTPILPQDDGWLGG